MWMTAEQVTMVITVFNPSLKTLDNTVFALNGRYACVMVSVLAYGYSSPGLSSRWGHYVVFLGKKLTYHSSSLHSRLYMGTGKFKAGG